MNARHKKAPTMPLVVRVSEGDREIITQNQQKEGFVTIAEYFRHIIREYYKTKGQEIFCDTSKSKIVSIDS